MVFCWLYGHCLTHATVSTSRTGSCLRETIWFQTSGRIQKANWYPVKSGLDVCPSSRSKELCSGQLVTLPVKTKLALGSEAPWLRCPSVLLFWEVFPWEDTCNFCPSLIDLKDKPKYDSITVQPGEQISLLHLFTRVNIRGYQWECQWPQNSHTKKLHLAWMMNGTPSVCLSQPVCSSHLYSGT